MKNLKCNYCDATFTEDMMPALKINPPIKYGDIEITKLHVCPSCESENYEEVK